MTIALQFRRAGRALASGVRGGLFECGIALAHRCPLVTKLTHRRWVCCRLWHSDQPTLNMSDRPCAPLAYCGCRPSGCERFCEYAF
jgi:hypothetical protein